MNMVKSEQESTASLEHSRQDKVIAAGRPCILVVDGDRRLQKLLRPALIAEGYRVLRADTAAEGLRIASGRLPRAVLLDLDLPDMDGHVALAGFCGIEDLPVLVVSARVQEIDKIAALDCGAYDYIEKPFAGGELLARLRAVLRKTTVGLLPHELLFENLTVDTRRRVALVGDAPAALTGREWALLLKLAAHAGRVVTHRQLLISACGPGHDGNLQYLRVYIGTLRQKLGSAGALITTVAGVGYRMADAVNAGRPDVAMPAEPGRAGRSAGTEERARIRGRKD